MSERPWCCPEPRCAPLHMLRDDDASRTTVEPGESFVCFGKAPEVQFEYDGVKHVNDLRSCHFSPLKGLVAFQENREDWEALKAAYWRALTVLDHLVRPESPRESETQWVDGRLRQVRGDGTLGATCVHCVGLTAGLWCGACMDLDPRVLPEPPVTAAHAEGRQS